MKHESSWENSSSPSIQKNSPHIFTSERSFLGSQEPDGFPSSERDQSNPRLSTHAICLKSKG